MKTKDMLRCPFCGGKPFLSKWDNGFYSGPRCGCDKCGYEINYAYDSNKQEAIKEWNKRYEYSGNGETNEK